MHRTRAELPNGVLKLCRMQLIDANSYANVHRLLIEIAGDLGPSLRLRACGGALQSD